MRQTLSLIFSFLIMVGYATAQKTLTEGYIKMEIVSAKSDDPQVQSMMQMMNGTETEFHFNKDKSFSTVEMMGGMMKIQYLSDYKTGETQMLMEGLGQKTLVVDNESNKVEEIKKNQSKTEVEYLKDEKKTILGYETYKAVVKTKGTNEVIYEAYVTEEIEASSSMIKGMQDFVLDGFPLEYTIKNEMMTMTIHAVEVEDKLDPKVFEINTDGYTKMTMEEFSKSMGGMNGLGF